MARPDAIQPVNRNTKVCMGLYGVPSVGKTRLIGGGDDTLIVRPPLDHTASIRTPGKNVSEWEVKGWQDMDEVLEFMRVGGGADEFKWVWLDSLSLFFDQGLDDIWEGVVSKKPHRKEYGLDKPEYGVNMERLLMWVRHMVGTPGFNFGWTAHAALIEDMNEDEDLLGPYCQGKHMPQKLCGYMNVIGYMEIKQGKRVLRTHLTDKYFAKDQYDMFPNGRLVEPTMAKITAALSKARPVATTNSGSRRATGRRRPRRPSQK